MAHHWLRPPLVSAPDATDRNRSVVYFISDHFLDCQAAIFRHTPVFQMWVHVVGDLPPINNISSVLRGTPPTICTLEDSVRAFVV